MKKSLSLIQYFLLFVVVYWIATVIEGVAGFDLHRTYEESRMYVDEFSVSELILYRMVKTVDFVFYLIHYYAQKASIPPNVVTAFIVFSYYCLIIYSIRKVYGCNVSKTIILVTLFTVPSIYVISVARNLTAFMFLFCAIVSQYKGYKFLSLFFIIVAVFTHFTTLIYVAVLVLASIIKNKRIQNATLLIILFVSFIVSLLSPTLIKDVIFDVIGGQDSYYENYSNEAVRNFLFISSLNYADKTPVTFAYVFSILLLFQNTKQGFEFWALLILTMMLTFFMNSSFSLVTRCLMFLPIFWGLNIGSIFKYSPMKNKQSIQGICYIGMFFLLLHLYGYRQIYFAFI